MFRKAMLTAMTVIATSSAFAAGPIGKARETGKERDKDKTTTTRESGTSTSSVNRSNKVLDVASQGTRQTTNMREAAIRLEEMANSPEKFGLEGASKKGLENFILEVENLVANGKSFDEAYETALARRGTNKDDLLEKCKQI